MKAALGLVSLLVVLGVVALLAKKQLPAVQPASQQTQPAQAAPQQIKQQLDAVMHQPREVPQDK
jgi:type II secretory pathway component PulM